ncbi:MULTISPECIES: 4'-phosphopantetheinyl transferase family protein [Streptomyces]|uniref:4'-phosphopantetheinyl transferase family protein n=1 Tax=Streptomyces TaxID=1883 RepID=UPI001164A236|nr:MULTISPECIES: 4'-phosphopantetheinyl transferase superfamily protein [Streptomyces]MCX4610353.1 4'-phosphopantetheinyl transferase superfamily protein [Streptomyces mirabilis]MCX5350573.1 4'-phosphopantetheinyl transferase superfamily protein [Streptomyces mirabilis]QDN88948.1 4'-phosphopantetheinyl transferase superfamily protein [Streptomyces sp. RLB3-6]QDO09778.1 4'-phosphopantetheinyl transferase superfamily protein [Streptomyces sp. S1D4-23]
MTPTVRRLAVARGELDVWLLPPPDSPRDVPYDELDAYERGRADSYRRPDDRQMYAAAHVGLRRVLAGYTGIEPSRLNLAGERYNGNGERHGRPVVLGVPGGAPQFSLSHSHGLAIVVVAESRVGADVQRLPSPQTAEACLPALHPAEREELGKIPEHERTMAFGRLWTRKEAYLKGLGTGLTRGADLDYLGEAGLAERPTGWVVGNLPLCSTHIAAVALAGTGDRPVAIRAVPTAYLYAPDAVERLVEMEPGLRSMLRDPAQHGDLER